MVLPLSAYMNNQTYPKVIRQRTVHCCAELSQASTCCIHIVVSLHRQSYKERRSNQRLHRTIHGLARFLPHTYLHIFSLCTVPMQQTHKQANEGPSPDDNTLVTARSHHLLVGGVSHGKNMWWVAASSGSAIPVHALQNKEETIVTILDINTLKSHLVSRI